MSLDWSVAKVKDYETVCKERDEKGEVVRWNPTTEALVWLCLGCDMQGITEKNKDKFFARVQTWEKVNGAMMQDDKGPIYITKEDVYAHVGLSTNVSTKSDAAFKKKMAEIALEKTLRKG